MVVSGRGGGVDAADRDLGAKPELHASGTFARGKDRVRGGAPVGLEQRVFKMDGRSKLASNLLEVNNDVVTLRRPYAETGHLHGFGQQIAIIRDDPKRNHPAQIV